MGYCWSVVVAALPEAGKPMMENWLDSEEQRHPLDHKGKFEEELPRQNGCEWVKTYNMKILNEFA